MNVDEQQDREEEKEPDHIKHIRVKINHKYNSTQTL